MQPASGSSSANAVHNGDSSFANNGAAAPSVSVTNGDAAVSDDESSPNLPVKELSPCDRDIVRLIGQHLKGLGLK